MRKPYILRVSSPKGGVGKSVISVNLAVALQELGYSTLVIDLDIVNPCVGLYMGVEDTDVGFLDVVKNKVDIRRAIVPHAPSGVRILPGKLYAKIYTIKDWTPTAKQLRALFEKVLKLSYDFVIVDTQPGIAYALPLDLYSEAMLVAMPYKASCISAVKMLDQYGKAKLKCSLVVNRYGRRSFELSKREIEEMVEEPVTSVLPDDDNVTVGVSEGVPVELLKKGSPFSKAIMDMARIYATRIGVERQEAPSVSRGLLGLIKRSR